MRITTGMINQAAIKSGNTKQTTLLDILNQKSSGNKYTSSTSGINASNALRKSNYELMASYCEEMISDTDSLAKNTEGATADVIATVKSVAKNYNTMYEKLGSSSDTPDQFYKKQLSQLATENTESLKAVGVTVASDGKLVVDEKMLATASATDLKKVFSNGSTFITKLNYVSGLIRDNANAMIGSLSNQYSASGLTYTANTTSGKHDYFS